MRKAERTITQKCKQSDIATPPRRTEEDTASDGLLARKREDSLDLLMKLALFLLRRVECLYRSQSRQCLLCDLGHLSKRLLCAVGELLQIATVEDLA